MPMHARTPMVEIAAYTSENEDFLVSFSEPIFSHRLLPEKNLWLGFLP